MQDASAQFQVLDPLIFDEYQDLMGDTYKDGLSRYLNDLGAIEQRVLEGFEGGDTEKLREAVHRLKSSSAQIGAVSLSTLCTKIEVQTKCGVMPDRIDIMEFEQLTVRLRDVLTSIL